MWANDVLRLLPKYEKCPDCKSKVIGNGEGGICIENDTLTRFCKCGFSITVNGEGDKIKC